MGSAVDLWVLVALEGPLGASVSLAILVTRCVHVPLEPLDLLEKTCGGLLRAFSAPLLEKALLDPLTWQLVCLQVLRLQCLC